MVRGGTMAVGLFFLWSLEFPEPKDRFGEQCLYFYLMN